MNISLNTVFYPSCEGKCSQTNFQCFFYCFGCFMDKMEDNFGPNNIWLDALGLIRVGFSFAPKALTLYFITPNSPSQ